MDVEVLEAFSEEAFFTLISWAFLHDLRTHFFLKAIKLLVKIWMNKKEENKLPYALHIGTREPLGPKSGLDIFYSLNRLFIVYFKIFIS